MPVETAGVMAIASAEASAVSVVTAIAVVAKAHVETERAGSVSRCDVNRLLDVNGPSRIDRATDVYGAGRSDNRRDRVVNIGDRCVNGSVTLRFGR